MSPLIEPPVIKRKVEAWFIEKNSKYTKYTVRDRIKSELNLIKKWSELLWEHSSVYTAVIVHRNYMLMRREGIKQYLTTCFRSHIK